MIDLHSHILPGVDDGPADWEGSLGTLRMAEAGGTTTIVATPIPMITGGKRNSPKF